MPEDHSSWEVLGSMCEDVDLYCSCGQWLDRGHVGPACKLTREEIERLYAAHLEEVR